LTTIGFVACSGAEEAAPAPAEEEAAPAEEEAAPAEEAASYDMTTVVKVTNVGWFQRMKEGVEQFGADRGHTSIMDGPADEGDAAKQNEIMENLIAEGVDAICLVPMNVQANEPVLKKIMGKSIALTDIGWELLNKRWMYFFFGLAILNECVWRTQTEEFWVNFKVWGMLPITLVFTGFQISLINKHKLNE